MHGGIIATGKRSQNGTSTEKLCKEIKERSWLENFFSFCVKGGKRNTKCNRWVLSLREKTSRTEPRPPAPSTFTFFFPLHLSLLGLFGICYAIIVRFPCRKLDKFFFFSSKGRLLSCKKITQSLLLYVIPIPLSRPTAIPGRWPTPRL